MKCLGCVYEADRTLAAIGDLPPGWRASREALGEPWERWERTEDEDDQAEPAHVCDRSPEAELKSEQKALSDIESFGLHVISVTGDGEHSPFTYSIGIEKTLGMPELIITGLNANVAHSVINECYARMKAGLVLAPGMLLDGLLGGDYQCVVGAVAPEVYGDYMGWAIWLYKGRDFRVLQIIFPSANTNRFPWDPDAAESFRKLQPLLSSPPPVSA